MLSHMSFGIAQIVLFMQDGCVNQWAVTVM